MKVIVAGSRSIKLQSVVNLAIIQAFNKWLAEDQQNWTDYMNPTIISGGAAGVDWLGEKYALQHNLKCEVFPANWEEFGKRAGILRNIEMGNYADALVAVWDGQSKGTKHMIDYMQSLNKPTHVHIR